MSPATDAPAPDADPHAAPLIEVNTSTVGGPPAFRRNDHVRPLL